MTFTIIKKGNNNFWHLFNNGAKEINLSDFQAVLDSVAQTFIIQALNGANIPQTAVGILDIIVIDETDASLEETFANVDALRTRLVELGYTPYLGAVADNITGLIEAGTNVTITGDGTTGSPYVISSSGGGGGGAVTSVNSDTGAVIVDLQSVTDEGNVVEYGAETTFAKYQTSADVFAQIASDDDGFVNFEVQQGAGEKTTYTHASLSFESSGGVFDIAYPRKIAAMFAIAERIQTTSFTAETETTYIANGTITVTDPTPVANKGYIVHVIGGTSTIGGVGYTTGALVYRFYDGSSWVSTNMNNAITIDATPTDGSSNAVSSNGVFDALATKVSKSDYTPAHSILVQQSGTGTPTALSVGNNTLVGRLSGGGSDINDLSVSDVRTLLSIDTDLATKVTFWGSAIDGDSVANTLTITPTYSQLIPANTFSAGDIIAIDYRATSPGAKTSITNHYFYVNTSNSLSGATQLAIFSTLATSRTLQMNRKLSVKGATTKITNPATGISTDVGLSASMTNSTIDWTVDQYLIFAIGHTVADQTMFGDFYSIQKM